MTVETADEIDALATADDKVSFSRLGYELRRPSWDDSDMTHVAGRTVLVTGANNGLGRAAAQGYAALGARVVLLARDRGRGERAVTEIQEETGNSNLGLVICDISSLASVREAAAEILDREPVLHVLVNNVGVLLNERQLSVDGYELSLATNLLGPYLLTELLLERIAASAPARIIEVSSGGMYSQRVEVEDPQTERQEFGGPAVYSRAKRAQVILTELRSQMLAHRGITCHSMHPGWAATPGVSMSIPDFEAKFRDILRTPEQGADTIVWLGSADEPATRSGLFWLDRRPRETHRSDLTRETDQERAALWAMCRRLTGLDHDQH